MKTYEFLLHDFIDLLMMSVVNAQGSNLIFQAQIDDVFNFLVTDFLSLTGVMTADDVLGVVFN